MRICNTNCFMSCLTIVDYYTFRQTKVGFFSNCTSIYSFYSFYYFMYLLVNIISDYSKLLEYVNDFIIYVRFTYFFYYKLFMNCKFVVFIYMFAISLVYASCCQYCKNISTTCSDSNTWMLKLRSKYSIIAWHPLLRKRGEIINKKRVIFIDSALFSYLLSLFLLIYLYYWESNCSPKFLPVNSISLRI